MTVAIGVVHFGDHGTLRVRVVVTPEHTDRVKGVAETSRPAEHHHARRRNSVIFEKSSYVDMVLLANPGAPPGDSSGLRERIEVDEPIGRPVSETVHEGRAPGMSYLGLVQHRNDDVGSYHVTPRDSAAATPERQPSSWKPHP